MSKHTGLVFMIFVVVAAGVVLLVLSMQNQPDTADTNSKTNTNATNTNATTVSEDGNYTLLQTAEPTVIGEITSYVFADGNALSVMPTSMQSVVLNETPIQSETDMTVAGVDATQYTLSSAKDGSLFTVVHIKRDGQLYDFRGSDEFLNHLDQYIEFN